MNFKLPEDKKIVIFDGVCNLCNSAVLYVIKRDKSDQFLFAPLQGELGKHLIKKFNIDTNLMDSIILYYPKNETIHFKAKAALKVAWHLTFPTKLLAIFIIVPSFISNWAYEFVAKNRYKWFGKKASCMVPTPELKSRFLN